MPPFYIVVDKKIYISKKYIQYFKKNTKLIQ